LYKAALNGHLSIVKYLVPGKVDVYASDADGWTALHNASSKVSFTNFRSWFVSESNFEGLS
jgi:ankyrin repeat protein